MIFFMLPALKKMLENQRQDAHDKLSIIAVNEFGELMPLIIDARHT